MRLAAISSRHPGRGRRLSAAWSLLLCVLAAACWAQPADAAVAYRSASASSSGTSGGTGVNSLDLTIPTPAGLVAGDLMVTTAQWVLKTANATTVTTTTPAGWTELSNNNQTGWAVEVWYKRATAADVAAASVTFTANFTNRNATAAGAITAYSGVAPTGSPVNWGVVKRTSTPCGGTGTSIANGSCGFASPAESGSGYTNTPGSLGVAAVMADRTNNTGAVDFSMTSGAAGTLVAHQGATGGGGVDGINTAVAYAAPNASGIYPGVGSYIGMTATATVQWTAFSFVLQPAPPCGLSGTLDITASPSSLAFPTTALTGVDVSATTAMSVTVDDGTTTDGTTSAGWNLSLNPTPFTNGSWTLPSTALSVQSASNSDAGGRCAAPVATTTYPLVVPTSTTTKVYGAAANSGRGASSLALGMKLAIPASARVGAYSSTWTFTLSTGP